MFYASFFSICYTRYYFERILHSEVVKNLICVWQWIQKIWMNFWVKEGSFHFSQLVFFFSSQPSLFLNIFILFNICLDNQAIWFCRCLMLLLPIQDFTQNKWSENGSRNPALVNISFWVSLEKCLPFFNLLTYLSI